MTMKRPQRNPFKGVEQLFSHFTEELNSMGTFPVDMSDEEDQLQVTADIPGYDEDEIDVIVENNTLMISAETEETSEKSAEELLVNERRHSSVSRSISLPPNVDVDSGHAEYNNGVLNITFNKKEFNDSETQINVE